MAAGERGRTSLLLLLPLTSEETLTLCLSFLESRDLLQLGACSRVWRDETSEQSRPSLWADLCRANFSGLPIARMPLEGRRFLRSMKLFQSGSVSLRKLFISVPLSHRAEAYPPPRYLHRIAVAEDGYAYLFGGDAQNDPHGSSMLKDDLWRLSMKSVNAELLDDIRPSWKCILADSSIDSDRQPLGRRFPRPTRRCAASWTYLNGSIYLFGGMGVDYTFLNDLWALDVISLQWRQIESAGPRPAGRWGHTSISYGGKLWLFGGSKPGAVFRDFWCLDVDVTPEPIWSQVGFPLATIPPVPAARGGHSATLIGSKMYVFGGNTNAKSFNDIWYIDLEQVEDGWTSACMLEKPPTRIGHSASAVGDRILVFGGRDFLTGSFRTEPSYFDTRKHEWRSVHLASGTPVSVTGHAVVPCSVGVFVWGGLRHPERTIVPAHEFLLLDIRGVTGDI
jgi:hypothetical protein